MEVLVCIPCLMTGGTEIQTLSLVEALIDAGHAVHVACYFEFSDVMCENYARAGASVHLLCPSGRRPQGIAATAASLWAGLRKLVREVKPDAAHVQYMAPGALPILILRSLGVRRILATAHTAADIYSANGLRQLRWLNRHVLKAFQCITLTAERSFFGSARLLDSAVSPGRHGSHFTVYNNIPSYISLCNGKRKFGSRLTVGVVSRLEHIKGMDLVVPAMAKVLEATDAAGAECGLLVVGDGSQRGLMEKQVRELGLEDRVEFVGRQPQSVLQDFYDRIDVLLMPSRSEGFGLTAVEGMARGCVPVVADVGGLPEVVRDGVDGRLHSPGDVDSLAETVRGLVLDRSLLERLSCAARKRAEAFGRDAYRNAIRRMYEGIMR